MPIYGEASNHSSVGLENPNLSDYPRAEHSLKQSQEITLNAGDAVFIPEGWFLFQTQTKMLEMSFWLASLLRTMLIKVTLLWLPCKRIVPSGG
jgi:hypothetical protein